MHTYLAPMYSATDKSQLPGFYKLLHDSNFHCWTNKYWDMLKAGDATLIVPDNSDWQEVAQKLSLTNAFKPVAYGHYPNDTRLCWPGFAELLSMLNNNSALHLGVGLSKNRRDQLERTGAKLEQYLCHVSHQAGISQPIDCFHVQEVATASMFDSIKVHDIGQLAFMPTRAEVSYKPAFFHDAYYACFPYTQSYKAKLPAPLDDCLFVVNRLTDVEYSQVQAFTGKQICYTNPTNVPGIAGTQVQFTKDEYYSLLSDKPNVWYKPHPQIWHVGKYELLNKFGATNYA